MSNAKRPNLERKHTRTTKAAADAVLDQGMRITVAGEVFEARAGDMSAILTRELRAATGMGFMQLMFAISQGPDIDLVATFIWLARRIRGERIELDDVEMDYRTFLEDVEFDDDAPGAEQVDGDADPEG